MTDRLLKPKEAADILRHPTQTLAEWRHYGRHPELSKPVEQGGGVVKQGRNVYYLESVVLKWAKLNLAV